MNGFATIEELMEFILEALCRGDVLMFEDGGLAYIERPENDALIIEFENGEPTRYTTATKQRKVFKIESEVRA